MSHFYNSSELTTLMQLHSAAHNIHKTPFTD